MTTDANTETADLLASAEAKLILACRDLLVELRERAYKATHSDKAKRPYGDWSCGLVGDSAKVAADALDHVLIYLDAHLHSDVAKRALDGTLEQ